METESEVQQLELEDETFASTESNGEIYYLGARALFTYCHYATMSSLLHMHGATMSPNLSTY